MTFDSLAAQVLESHKYVLTPEEFAAVCRQGAPVHPDGTFHAGDLAAWLVGRELGTIC